MDGRDRAEKWPSLEAEPWIPDHAGQAVIVCERGDQQPMTVVWHDSAAEAEEADRALYDRPS